MADKQVLISYLDRNKIIKIPSSAESDELSYLNKEFKAAFSFGANVNIQVTFQKFDKEWGEFIDLETPIALNHKDKLKAVVMPLLVDNTPISSTPASVADEVSTMNIVYGIAV